MLGCLDGFGGLCVVLGEALWWVGSGTNTFADGISESGAHFSAHTCAQPWPDTGHTCADACADSISECGAHSRALSFADARPDTSHACAISIADTLAHCCAHGIAYSGSDLEADG